MRIRTYFPVLATTLCLVLPPFAHAQTTDLASKLAKIEETLERQYKERHIPGIAIAIVKDDQIIYKKGFGLRDIAKNLPATPETLFAIGSSTKAFTAMSVLMSVDEQKLSLDDAPRKYLPYFRLHDSETDSRITLRDLLCHRSGLPRTDYCWYTGVLRPEEVIRATCAAVPTAKLGEKFQYQNVMFLTAGEIVGKVQHTSWQNFVRNRIFTPLGMKQSNFTPNEMTQFPDYALGYDYDRETKETRHLPIRNATNCAPAGAINSNVNEMAQWIRLMLNGGVYNGKRLVSEARFAELTKPHILMGGNAYYGLGWMLRDWNGHKVVEHGGNIDGFNAQVALMPDQKLGFVLLTNVSASSLGITTMQSVWTNLVGGEKRQEAPPAVATASSVKPQEEVGVYRLAENMDIAFEFKDGKLLAKVPGQPTYPLEPLGGRKYRLGAPAPSGFFVTFRPKKENPKVTEVFLEQPQGNAVLEKREDKVAFKSPITVDELLQKSLEAMGGETNLRKIKTVTLWNDMNAESQGFSALTTQYYKAPNLFTEKTELYAVGKKIGTLREYFDGKRGGIESSFAPPTPKGADEITDLQNSLPLYSTLEAKRLFKNISITGIEKVNDEDAYVVLKTPEQGTPVRDYISTKTFRLLRSASKGGTATYYDFRKVNNIVLPFRTSIATPDSGNTIITLLKVKFDEVLAGSLFRATPTSETPSP